MLPEDTKIYNWPDVPLEDLYDVVNWQTKPYRKIRYLRNIIALDTETAKYNDDILFITDWSFTIEEFGCIYGNKVEDLVELLRSLIDMLDIKDRNRMVIFVHNYSYDYMFLRNHMLQAFGAPVHTIASKPHKYISMQFENGLEFRDSYILTGRSLDRFTKDMGCQIKKQTGTWDYDKFRTPGSGRTELEKFYVCADTISLVQALRIFFRQHTCNISTVEYTNTGFVRAAGLKASKTDKAWRSIFRSSRLDREMYLLNDEAYHGGYTHANRYYISRIMKNVTGYDFASHYPAMMLYKKFPMHDFRAFHDPSISAIIDLRDVYAFIGYLLLTDVELHRDCPMPPISRHKCRICNDAILDNGRVVSASMLVVPFTDPDLQVILDNYDYSYSKVSNVYYSPKEYLPVWFCELIMEFFRGKTEQKGKDPLLYALNKGMLNSLYGMCVQKIIREDILEDFESGEWKLDRVKDDPEKAQAALDAFYKNRKKYLPFQWGVWVTAYAQEELFKLGSLCGTWIYSDTDSVKGLDWDLEGLQKYNDNIRRMAASRGYGSLQYNGKEYTIGVAEYDGTYEEFVTLGSKRYCYREDGELHITVAGVPKIGVAELQDDIRRFRKNMVFQDTHKTASVYINREGIHRLRIGEETIEYGCCIRLDPVEYTLDQTVQFDKKTGKPFAEFMY